MGLVGMAIEVPVMKLMLATAVPPLESKLATRVLLVVTEDFADSLLVAQLPVPTAVSEI